MVQDTKADMERQRADENERLRRLAAEELASMRIELARALEDRVVLHHDLNLLAERLSQQEDLTFAARGELVEAVATSERQAAHIARLKKQTARPVRLLAKKILRRSPQQSGSDNAS